MNIREILVNIDQYVLLDYIDYASQTEIEYNGYIILNRNACDNALSANAKEGWVNLAVLQMTSSDESKERSSVAADWLTCSEVIQNKETKDIYEVKVEGEVFILKLDAYGNPVKKGTNEE